MAAEKKKFSRRKFIVRTLLGGAGVIVGTAYLGRNSMRRAMYSAQDDPAFMAYVGDTSDPKMWFEVTSENKVIFHSPKVEMGQGTFTGLAQIAADELDLNIGQIDIVHAQSKTGNIDQLSTGGSTSIAGLYTPLRELAATLKQMLVNEAAKKMEVDASSLSVAEGKISGGGKSLTYGETVEGVEEWTVPEEVQLKDRKDFKYIGNPVSRVDLEDKVFGEPIFGMDATLPDMVYGSILRPTKIGAKFKSADTSRAESMPGVIKVVKEDDFVGVVAESQHEAETAKLTIRAEWETERDWSTEDIEAYIKVGEGNKMIVQKSGDAGGQLDEAEENGDLISAEYKSPIGAHAQLEPNGCLAHVDGDKATIVLSTQVVKLTRTEVANRLGLEEENVNLIPTYLGGGFGRRLHTPHAMQAAVLSKAVGKPVKCYFNRKEEFQHDTFRPPTHHVMKARLTESGDIGALEHNYASGDVMYNSALLPGFVQSLVGSDIGALRGGMIQYGAIPNHRAVAYHRSLPFATSWWRSLGLLANTFVIETFIDELAEKAGKDPLQFRSAHIQSDEAGDRLKKVIEVAGKKAGYKNEVSGNRAMGFACSTDAGTPCAQVVDVSVEGDEIKVHKVVCVMDPGLAVNPDQVKAQCEGSIIMGLSASLYEKMEVKNSQLRPTIYGAYKMALMRNAPKEIDVELIDGTGIPGPVGEPPLGPIGAAIANALYRITGKRNRELPLSIA